MNMERDEKSESHFDVEPSDVDRTRGHVDIPHNGKIYKWFLDTEGRIILRNGRENELSEPVCAAMKRKVAAILGPELKKLQEVSIDS